MTIGQKTQFLAALPLFAALRPDQLAHLAEAASLREVPRFQFVFMQDEPAEQIFCLVSGRLRLGYFSPEGREVVKSLLKPHAIFGEQALLSEQLRPDFAQAMHEPIHCLAIQVVDFQELMNENFRLTTAFLHFLNQRMTAVEERLASLILKDARQRIIEFLLQNAGRDGRKVGLETLITLNLTQQDIAHLSGTSRQTVTSVLNELRKNNLIYFNRTSILIRDLTKLA